MNKTQIDQFRKPKGKCAGCGKDLPPSAAIVPVMPRGVEHMSMTC